MDLVVDANVFFSVLIKRGKTEELIFDESLHLFAPEYIFEEFKKYLGPILEKTDRTPLEFDDILKALRRRIVVIPNEETERYIRQAKIISPDVKDADYVALALLLNCAIWSQDKALRNNQSTVKVYSTEELDKLLG